MTETLQTPSSLLTQCKQNQAEGWQKMHMLFGRLILYWCKNAGLNGEDRNDVYQDVMLTLVKSIHSFQKNNPNDKFRKWLRAITRTRIVDFYRRKQTEPQNIEHLSRFESQTLSENEMENPEEDQIENELLFQQIFELLKKNFTPQTMEAFRLMCYRGATSEEVAKILGMTSSAVRAAKKRVLDQIRQQFGDLL
ncbi:MAG: sigma-70 family RNA polymerase sigma factor [Thermoguttaceae bacterium]|nr:sigma-70 family RNA polymerase sigma factor [Thermoguttaceae bacterium]